MAGFDDTLGAVFIGFSVALVLFGMLSMQMYTYFQRFSLDRPVYKAMVIAVWALETLHSALSGHVVYYYAITNYTNPLALIRPTWSIVIQVLIGALISVLVKSAFTMRVWRFSGNSYVLTGFIAILNLAILTLAIIFTFKAFQVETFLELPKIKWVTISILSVSVFTDIFIAASLTYYLHHIRNAFSANTLVNGLIRYSIETGAITSICGIATLVAFNALPLSFVYLAFFFVLSKLYSNSLMATLNTRRVVRGRGTDREPGSHGDFTIVQGSHIQTTHSIFGPQDWSKRPTDTIQVNVSRETASFSNPPTTITKLPGLHHGSSFAFDRPADKGQEGQEFEMENTPTESDSHSPVPPDYALSSVAPSFSRGNEVYAYGGSTVTSQRRDHSAPPPPPSGRF